MQRRCLTAKECLNMTRRFRSRSIVDKWKLFKPQSKERPMECVIECPTGYQADDRDTHCVKCNNSCPKGQNTPLSIGKSVRLTYASFY